MTLLITYLLASWALGYVLGYKLGMVTNAIRAC